jgi:glucokinase
MAELLVGVDLGGTNMRAGVVTAGGEVLERKSVPTQIEDGHGTVIHRMGELIRDVVASADAELDAVQAVGIGSPGPLSAKRGVVIFTPNLGWKNVPVADMLSKDLDRPVYLENDANSACWGEFWAGAGRSVSNMIILTLGTGVGGSVILGGKLWRGPSESAGHIGHMIVEPDGLPCGCGGRGCLEQYASATAVARVARDALAGGKYSRFIDCEPEEITARDVSEAADRGCELCNQIMRDAGRYLGLAIATLANVINPDLAVIYGGMAAAGERLFQPMRDTVNERALDVAAEHIRIVPADLDDDAGLVGAAGLALRRLQGEAVI